MNPIKLVGTRSDGKEVHVHACGTCGFTAANEAAAEACCKPNICACGKPTGARWRSECDACAAKAAAERTRQTFEKAKKTPHEAYAGGMVFCDCCDKYFHDVEELLDDHDRHDRGEPPTWAWACTEEKLSMDAEEVVHDELERREWFEDAQDWTPDLKELQAALDQVCAQIPPCYRIDHSEVVTFEDLVEQANTEKESA